MSSSPLRPDIAYFAECQGFKFLRGGDTGPTCVGWTETVGVEKKYIFEHNLKDFHPPFPLENYFKLFDNRKHDFFTAAPPNE